MNDAKKIYDALSQVHKIKKKEIKITRRKKIDPEFQNIRETSLFIGSVWGINDRSVSFDGKRRNEDFKNSLRPSLVLKTPLSFNEYDLVWCAPGTSQYHNSGKNYPPCLVAEVPPRILSRTTYFLIYYSWYAAQLTLNKKIVELSSKTKEVLSELLMREEYE